MPTSPQSRRRTASARRQLFAVITAAFIILQQFVFIFPTTVSAQTTRKPGRLSPSASSETPPTGNNSTSQTLPFTQNWTNTGLITTDDNWTGVPGIEGFLGDRTATGTTTGIDPQTILDPLATIDVIANQTSTTITNGGVAEFHTTSQSAPDGTNPVVALQGSGTADHPNIILYLNTTGLTGINVAYNLRDIDCTADNAVQAVALQFRVGSSGNFTNVPAGFVTDATTGPSVCTAVTAVSTALPAAAENQSNVQVRIITSNAAGNDEWVGIDDINITGTSSGGQPSLSINDVTQNEGNAGTTAFTFTVSLSSSTHGGVTFDIATADGTAQDDNPTTEDNDYVAKSLSGQTIANGSNSLQFTVDVNGDTTTETNETFFVNVTSVTGATVGDGQGQGTITNDDITLTAIHDIQGNGDTSPLAGQTVTTTGIVTLLRTSSNAGGGAASGFFLQDPNADADPNTSEGIFVFTSTVPTVAVGDEVNVTGTVVEFNGLTEISSVTSVSVLDTGNTLPTAVTLDSTILSSTAAPTKPQLEKFEAMRMTAASLKSVSPNDNFFDVDVVLSSVARQQVFREPGIPASDPVPPDPTTGTPDCCIPIWDENPERLNLDTNGRAGAPNTAYTSNVTFTNVAGPLDFAFGEYRLIPDTTPTASANMNAVPVPVPLATEFTVAGYNIENFNNNATQREKASLTVRTILHYPDIIGAVEIFDLADLQALRDEINNDAVAAGDPNPQYEAFLVEQDGTSEDNDQDVGYLVKTSRVSVTSVTQEREEETFVEPGTGTVATLHDRPPLVLDATVDPSGASPRRVLVVVNHLRSFIDVDLVAGDGPRVREKRKKQAESLAGLLQELQTNNPTTSVISVGDYNAFQFSSGYDDSTSVIKGNPTPDDQIVVDQSPDLVNPDFINLIDEVPAAERYSFIFEGTPQILDQVLVNTVANGLNTRIAIARVNSDFPDSPASAFETNAARAERNSDHDPVVSYFTLAAPQAAGSLIISEFRLFGPNGPAGTPAPEPNEDEFIEIYNNTDAPITVTTTDGSAGFAVAASDGVIRCTIPVGTVIPARGHFLCANSDGYSLGSYPAGDETTATADATYTDNIPNNTGIALFNTANTANFSTTTRLDAVGSTSEANTLYKEGTGYSALTQFLIEHSLYRDLCGKGGSITTLGPCPTLGLPKDTDNNSVDFVFVDTNGTSAGAGQRLGAPGPENLASPIQRNSSFAGPNLDNTVGTASPPNRVRDFTSDPANNSTFGTLDIRKRIVNNTGAPVTRLRFRVIDITTFPAPSGFADLRPRTSTLVVVSGINDAETCLASNGVATTPCTVNVQGTTLEQPPSQPNGGGFNSTLSAGTVTLGTPLANGASINVRFLLGIQQTGTFKFFINVESDSGSLPQVAPGKWDDVKRKK